MYREENCHVLLKVNNWFCFTFGSGFVEYILLEKGQER